MKVIAGVLALVLVASTFPAGVAGASEFPHTKCDPSGDSCVSVRKIKGVRMLRLVMLFRYVKKHQVCVKGPHGKRTCHTYRTRKFNGWWGSSINWRKSFPFEGPGVYRVTWHAPSSWGSLKFRVRGGATR
jgi:hypothetical protein